MAENENSEEAVEEIEETEEEPKQEQKKGEDYRERMLVIAAEFDNYKKRVRNDVENAKSSGKAELMKDLLPIVDEFELALISAENSSDKNVVKGIEMVYSNMLDALKKEGLKEIPTNGAFDPYKHEIIMVKESKKAPGTIIEVAKKGYTLGNLVLRPASVIVSQEKTKENETKNNIE